MLQFGTRVAFCDTPHTYSRSPARSPGCTGSPDPRTGVCCSGRVLSWTRRSFRHLLRPKNRDRQRDPEMGSRPTRRSPTKTPKDLSRYSFDRRIEPKQLMGLLRQAGWAKQRSIEGVRRMLEGTSLTLGAWEGDRLVAFARAMTDGIYRALIDDVPLENTSPGRWPRSERYCPDPGRRCSSPSPAAACRHRRPPAYSGTPP